ncbi:I78 family peptidase inhibitor [Rhizobium sp. AB2/73]|uniref:I78 family peptidase inhibitor n=1 Tax=Rhizobium sp. AB2/73 TaxID=2795216 RepID=UPI001C60733C|nr:I78 family peptidase inhibitor [Rhizobium sp. AB2/73]QYA17570.1 hypothetical protein J5284_34685 [Rhizobium sp. AB2/73]UEQ85902.1 hypothetical protein I8E17_34665 [Rhizobium sp. AB2/73]
MPKLYGPLLMIGLLPTFTACSSETATPPSPQAVCNTDAAQKLVGQKPTDEEVLLLTKAKSLRRIEPGMMVTHDFREDRVTIESDPQTGRVLSAKCG